MFYLRPWADWRVFRPLGLATPLIPPNPPNFLESVIRKPRRLGMKLSIFHVANPEPHFSWACVTWPSCAQSQRANLHPDQIGLCIRPEIKERGLPWLYKGQVILRCIKCGECQGKPPEEKQLQTERPKTRRKTEWKNNSVVLLILED